MRHHQAGRKLGRNSSHRKAMFRNMVAALFFHEKIHTTDAKAKELRRISERLITKAIRVGDAIGKDSSKLSTDERRRMLHVRRVIGKFLPRYWTGNDESVDLHYKLFTDIAPRYKGRPGGYTRITKLGPRLGDNAPIAQIELLEAVVKGRPVKDKAVKDKPVKGKAAKAKPAPAKK